MRHAIVSVILVLLPALTLAQAEPPSGPKAGDLPGLLEVPLIGIVDVNGKWSFNEGRQYAIAVNKHLHDAKASRSKLAAALGEKKRLDQVVFGWFGKKPPARLNLLIGDSVPVEVAQAVIAAYADAANLPVHIALMTEDEQLGNTRAVYVGSLVDCDNAPVTPEQIRELLKPGLTREQLARLLAKKSD